MVKTNTKAVSQLLDQLGFGFMTADVVMVTGVLGGIGTAIKIALEERGFRVIGLDLAGDEDENHIVFDLATLVDEKVHGELVGEVELRLSPIG